MLSLFRSSLIVSPRRIPPACVLVEQLYRHPGAGGLLCPRSGVVRSPTGCRTCGSGQGKSPRSTGVLLAQYGDRKSVLGSHIRNSPFARHRGFPWRLDPPSGGFECPPVRVKLRDIGCQFLLSIDFVLCGGMRLAVAASRPTRSLAAFPDTRGGRCGR